MEMPITQQPSSGFTTEFKNPDNIPGLEKLSYVNEVTVRQDRARFLEGIASFSIALVFST